LILDHFTDKIKEKFGQNNKTKNNLKFIKAMKNDKFRFAANTKVK